MKQIILAVLTVVAFQLHGQVYGPSGTNWPGDYDFVWPNNPTRPKLHTPHPKDRNDPSKIAHVYNVNCNYGAIQSTLAGLTSQQVDEGVLILVAPGTLQGLGTGSEGSSKVLNEVGDPTWSKRVTVAPRDGYGSVKVTSSRYFRVHNVCFAGFEFTRSMKVEASRNIAFAWGTWRLRFSIYAFEQDNLMDGVEFIEMVNYRESDTYTPAETAEDFIEVYGDSIGGDMEYFRFAGCWIAGKYLHSSRNPSDDHVDAIQFSPRSFDQHDMLFEYNVFVASSNTAMQTGGTVRLYLIGNLMIGGTLGREYYPRPTDSYTGGAHAWINGNGSGFEAYDNWGFGQGSLTDGPPASFHWEYTNNSYVSVNYNGWTPDDNEPATEAARLSGNYNEPARVGYWNTTNADAFREVMPQKPNFYTLYEKWKSLAPDDTRWTPNNAKRTANPKRIGIRL